MFLSKILISSNLWVGEISECQALKLAEGWSGSLRKAPLRGRRVTPKVRIVRKNRFLGL